VHWVGACRAHVSYTSVAIYRESLVNFTSEPYIINADKRKAVETLLADENWTKWSDERLHAALTQIIQLGTLNNPRTWPLKRPRRTRIVGHKMLFRVPNCE